MGGRAFTARGGQVPGRCNLRVAEPEAPPQVVTRLQVPLRCRALAQVAVPQFATAVARERRQWMFSRDHSRDPLPSSPGPPDFLQDLLRDLLRDPLLQDILRDPRDLLAREVVLGFLEKVLRARLVL